MKPLTADSLLFEYPDPARTLKHIAARLLITTLYVGVVAFSFILGEGIPVFSAIIVLFFGAESAIFMSLINRGLPPVIIKNFREGVITLTPCATKREYREWSIITGFMAVSLLGEILSLLV